MQDIKQRAFLLVALFGLVSLFGDITYEGARSVNGPFMLGLGATAAVVGLVAGLGEFLGYSVRLASGYLSDKTGSYWFFTIAGYALLASVPLLAVAAGWQVAALFIVMERLGKALRGPAKDTLMSQAAKHIGTGFGFGLHEAMDQIGAIAGPLIFAAVLATIGAGSPTEAGLQAYRFGYGLLWLPVALTLASVVVARFLMPNLEQFDSDAARPGAALPPDDRRTELSPVFWVYSGFTFFVILGFSNFAILAFHYKASGLLSAAQIPLLYAVAMGVDGGVALVAGRLYDRIGLKVLFALPFLTIPIPFLALAGSSTAAVASVMLWGLVMGIHETVVRAAVADLTPLRKRGVGYGVFHTVTGLAFFFGAAAFGLLYQFSFTAILVFTVIAELAAVPFLLWILGRGDSVPGGPAASRAR